MNIVIISNSCSVSTNWCGAYETINADEKEG